MTMDAATLVLETLRLGDDTDPERLRRAWSAVDTRGLARLVEFEGCALWLLRRGRQAGALSGAVPHFREALEQRAHEDAARNLLVDAATEAIARFLARAGVPVVLIKGAAYRALAHRFPFADARATNDVDVLVPAALAQDVWHGLRARGYGLVHPGRAQRPGHHHLAGLLGPDGVGVELHTSTVSQAPPEVTWQRLTAAAVPVERFGLRVLVPCATELLWDAMIHALHRDARGFRLHRLLEAACLLGVAGQEAAEWVEVRGRLARRNGGGSPDPVLGEAWLSAAAWLGGDSDPTYDLPRALRWRLALLRRLPAHAGVVRQLAAEATHLDLGLPAGPTLRRGLRPVGAALFRGAYRWWRARAS